MKDQVLRTLADMENLRERSARQIESNKQFAVQVRRDLLQSVPAPESNVHVKAQNAAGHFPS